MPESTHPPRATRHASGMHVGPVLTLQQQVHNLRLLGEGGLLRTLGVGAALAAVGGLVAFPFAPGQSSKVVALFIAGCGALVGLGALANGPGMRHAAAATRKGRSEPATIVLHPGVDDEARESGLSGVLCPASPHAPRWRMHFAKADGWSPPEGTLHVQAALLIDLPWPVLLVHPDVLLVPLGKPVRAP